MLVMKGGLKGKTHFSNPKMEEKIPNNGPAATEDVRSSFLEQDV